MPLIPNTYQSPVPGMLSNAWNSMTGKNNTAAVGNTSMGAPAKSPQTQPPVGTIPPSQVKTTS